MMDIVPAEQMKAARRLQEVLSVYRKAEDLIHIGAYKQGSNAKIDEAIRLMDPIQSFLCQGVNEKVNYDTSVQSLSQLFQRKAA
jgi:flagellum-specific ATP synthase